MSETAPTTIRRILLALDSTGEAGALEAALTLASNLRAHLTGLYVEDSELLRHAALPFAREIALSAAVRPLDPSRLEQELRANANRLRRLLEHRAGPLRLAWSFQVMRGAVPTVVLAASEAVDIYIITPPQPTLFRSPATRHRQPLVALYDGTAGAARAVETAAALLRPGSELHLLLPEAGAERYRRQVERLLRGSGAHLQFQTVSEQTPEAILRLSRSRRAGLIVLDERPGLRDPAAMRHLLEAAPCPVVVTRKVPRSPA